MSKNVQGELWTNTLFDVHDDWNSGATFADCRSFRYALWRRWPSAGEHHRMVAFIGVNPSVANEYENDRTITRCINFAESWGYDGMLMLNAFAHVQTKLGSLKLANQHIGQENDATMLAYRDEGATMVAAWGNHCPQWRADTITKLLGRELQCLGRNTNGTPRHPLFLRADTKLEPFWQPQV